MCIYIYIYVYVYCCCSVTQTCPTLCDPMDGSTPSFPVLHCLLEFAHTHVHWVDDAIQLPHLSVSSSCPQSFPASGSFPMSQLSASGGQELQLQHQSFQWILRVDFSLGLTGLISLLSKGLSRVFSSTTVWKHLFFSLSLLYGPTLTSIRDYWKNHSFDYIDLSHQSDVSDF